MGYGNFANFVAYTAEVNSLAISIGIKNPLDYSVFSASAGALLLALYHTRGSGSHL